MSASPRLLGKIFWGILGNVVFLSLCHELAASVKSILQNWGAEGGRRGAWADADLRFPQHLVVLWGYTKVVSKRVTVQLAE
ncbi:MAG TPA: hypothetical protein DCY27_13835 [Desulfobacterales bacterium]|nr:hypothetical protein [Desulfobacterales bacterium]